MPVAIDIDNDELALLDAFVRKVYEYRLNRQERDKNNQICREQRWHICFNYN